MKFIFSLVSSSILTLGCASQKPILDCANTDWFEIGRRQGATGESRNKLNDLKLACAPSDSARYQESLLQLENGYRLGLQDYCSEENALIMGRSGIIYKNSCPESLETTFKENYERGERFKDLNENRRQIDARLYHVREELTSPKTSIQKRILLEGEREELNKKSAELKNNSEPLDSSGSKKR
jgi:hypothetical protein